MNLFRRVTAFLTGIIMALVSFGFSFLSFDQGEAFDIELIEAGEWQGKYLFINGERAPAEAAGGEAVAGSALPAFTFSGTLSIRIDDPNGKSFNYYGLSVMSSEPLRGTVTYSVLGVPYTEEFFIEQSAAPAEVFSFTDGYFENKKGFRISGLAFENLGAGEATLEIGGIAYFNRTVLDETVFVSDTNYKMGVSLRWGGALSYLQYLPGNVQAVRTAGDVLVGVDALAKYGGELITNQVNLINRNDTGRLVQQSYYGTNGEHDGYIQGTSFNTLWSYNPVQGGNQFGDASKIIDVKTGADFIYIKCRPMDWAKPAADITPSTMEATYTLKDGYVKVACRFVDFSRWESVYRGQELPAFYAIEPLNSFRYYGGAAPWTGDGEIKREDRLIFWPDAGMPTFQATEYWCAWTNLEDDGFGIGLYVPGISNMLAGVYDRDGNIGADPSASGPTSYVAALKALSIRSFAPLEYGYLVAAGNISELRDIFVTNKDAVDNTKLLNY